MKKKYLVLEALSSVRKPLVLLLATAVLSFGVTGSVMLVQHYPKEIPVILFSLSILISLIMDRQRVRFSSRVSAL